ncbi:hypothetical protein [Aquimarina sp. 2201CG5-10]|uniref:hypothetical protein n=1 Tax=Aquimarina callyspongiae TaxID=3098150 RepID=UPI002AB41355|nr:hypothetical protein [Aquimarina sp. 2201CG5-10]MDY8138854.1 hypothetical protein [Aquimarina sp. 2201CG5-10]
MRRVFKWLLEIGIIGFIVIILFELSYRFSVIDFYMPDFKALNNEKEMSSKTVDYLVFGDSFSASKEGYVDLLRKSSNRTFINSSVPGIGIKQVNSFASRRLKEFEPKNILYQVYVGNDLTDVNQLTNYKKLSIARNLYWDISDIVLSAGFINYKLRHLNSKKKMVNSKFFNTSFNVENYNLRSKIYLKSDSTYIYQAVTITKSFRKRYLIWKEELVSFLNKIPENTNVYIVFIPHCTQLNSFYRDNISQIGAMFNEEHKFGKINYYFFEKASLDFDSYKNVIFLNPLQKMRESDNINNRLYYLNDPHLNSTGQQVLTEYLREYLQLN